MLRYAHIMHMYSFTRTLVRLLVPRQRLPYTRHVRCNYTITSRQQLRLRIALTSDAGAYLHVNVVAHNTASTGALVYASAPTHAQRPRAKGNGGDGCVAQVVKLQVIQVLCLDEWC